MKNKLISIALPTLILFVVAPVFADEKNDKHFGEFKSISIFYEENVTDNDAEVVIKAKAFEGMKAFSVYDPSGKKIVKLKSKDLERIGLEQFILESGEPAIDLIKSSYPEGIYQFRAKTVSGEHLYAELYLSHIIAPPPMLTPCGEENLPAEQVVARWPRVVGAVAYEIEIEQDELEVNVTATLDGDATEFTVPTGFLTGGTTYEVGISSINSYGNVTVAECEFSTAQ